MSDINDIPVREAAQQQPAPTPLPITTPTAPAPTGSTTAPAPPAGSTTARVPVPALVATTRVWSLTGCGHTDEVMGVRFDKHYVDVDAETAKKLVARKQEHIVQTPDGKGGFTEKTELLDLYSTTQPAHLKAKDKGAAGAKEI